MRRYLIAGAVLALVVLGLWTFQRHALAAPLRTGNIYDLLAALNGTGTRVGVIQVTDAGNATLSGLTVGEEYLVQCDGNAHVNSQATCSGSYTSSSFCPWNAANERIYIRAGATVMSAFPADGGVTVNCPVLKLE